MAPMKRARVESTSPVGSGAGPASKRSRAVQSRVDTGLRAGAAAERQEPPRQRPALKRPPLAPRQPSQDRPAATRPTPGPKVDTHSRPAAVSQQQLEAWREARRQKLAERILRGRQGSAGAAAAACLGMDAERQRGAAHSRPRAVASRVLQPRPAARTVRAASAEPPPAAMGPPRPPPPPARAATTVGPRPAVGGIRLNKAAQRRLTLMHARRQQAERDAERRSTLAAARPAARPPPAPAARRQTFAGTRPARRPTAARRSPAAARRSPRSAPGSAPRVTAVKAGLSKERLAALARPKQPPQKPPSPPRPARVVKPVQRRPTVAPSVGGSLAPPAGLPDTMRRSLSAMHRSHSAANRATAMHRPAARGRAASEATAGQPADESDEATAGSVAIVTGATPGRAQPAATPGRAQPAATPGRAQPAATPGRAQPAATSGRAQPAATPGRARPSAAKPRLPSNQTLQERLEHWLASRGKQLSSFKHLHCFGREVARPVTTPAVKARRLSTVQRVQLDPGSPPLRPTPTQRSAKRTPTAEAPETSPAAGAATEQGAPPAAAAPADDGEKMDNVLSDLRELQELGLPSDQVISWLERLSSNPVSAGRARFWLCRASAAERDGQLDQVLHCFRQASRAHAEPVAELISGLEQFVRRAAAPQEDAENAPPPAGTPARRRADGRTPRRPLLDCSNVFDSSVIKYALVDDEPVLKKLAALRLGGSSGDILSVITPVRRSTRRKSLKPPADAHLALFDSVEAISESLRRSALFRRNSALVSP